MARISWFDEQTKLPSIDEQAQKLESFTAAMSDGVIEKQELAKQQESLSAIMREVEAELTDAQHAKVTQLLLELSAYNIMRLVHDLQAERLQRSFNR